MRWGMSPETRFWNYVDRTDIQGCWPWKGKISNGGRPRFRISKVPSILVWAERQAWEFIHGPIEAKRKKVRRLCSNPICVNPAHHECKWKRTKEDQAARNAQQRKSIKDLITDLKKSGCLLCGFQGPPECFDFHHRNPSDKKFTISSPSVRSLASIQLEIAKCDLLCANCHRKQHRANS